MYDFSHNDFFRQEEFECPCCGRVGMEWHFMHMLTEARRIADVSFVISSGYRCPAYNLRVGGAEDSAHTYGVASDISCNDGHKRWHVVRGLWLAGFKRIFVYKKHIHADVHPKKKAGYFGYGEYRK